MYFDIKRRKIIKGSGLILGSGILGFPAFSYAGSRPNITHGVQIGDVSKTHAVIWSRSDKSAKLFVELSTDADFKESIIVPGPYAMPETGFTSKLLLDNLTPEKKHYYRVHFQGLDGKRALSDQIQGSFITAPMSKRDVTFVWSGDVAGQGWGINKEDGGMRTWKTMQSHNPDFFIHSGDTVYADGPIFSEVILEDGSIWKNIVTEEVSKVAETLDEFRGRYLYNLMDENLKEFNLQVPVFAQWDDHEVTNNWYPSEILVDDRYTETSVDLLSARASKAFFEHMPIMPLASEPIRVYRQIDYGPHLDIFMLDARTYRGPNTKNRQAEASGETVFWGKAQIEWLKQSLKSSTKTWKVIAADMPIGLMVKDGDNFENSSNGDGPVLGREFDVAQVLKFIKNEKIKNVVWITADVHYTAAHYYDPNKAQFQEFEPFWEFVTGPIHAGTFGPGELDNTFGPQVEYYKAPPDPNRQNLPPSDGYQFFAVANINGESGDLMVKLMDRDNNELYQKILKSS